ncbi:MAG: RNA polymerase subunit sigma-70, partial [Gemmatimonadetes bacterium]|nr:RNA polymerase subunit sigma-70 [Gemmatimonadota bacterium]
MVAMEPAPSDVTRLLQQWSDGDRQAVDRLVPLLYEHLRQLAHQRLRHEDASPTLNTTALVHEAYLKLV